MSGISHNQAIQLIHRRMDGMLNEKQLLSLDEHLRSCASCRVYATEIDLLPTHLQSKFHARWDEKPGPSQKVFERVTARAKRIPMTNRISSGMKLFASVATLLALGILINLVVSQMHSTSISASETETENNSVLAENRLLAFTSDQNGNFDIYTMHADGSGLTNITNNPANDLSPLWSPDGQKIAFTSERAGNTDIFVMDSDGRNLTRLTENPGYDGFFSWSPDGQRIVYLSSSSNNRNIAKLMVVNVDGSNLAVLTKEPGSYNFLSWSPDGQKIIYQNIKDAGIYIVSVNSQNRYQWLVNNNDQIHWEDSEHFLNSSWNGVSEQPQWLLRRFSTNGDIPLKPLEVASHTSPIVAIFENTYVVEGGSTLAWYSMDKNQIPLATWNFKTRCKEPGDLFLPETTHKISPDQNHAFVTISCFEGPTWFYFENANGSEIKQLTNFSVAASSQILDRVWSPDGKYVVLTIADSVGGKADIYLFDIEKMLKDASIQPIQLTTDEAMKYGAVWQPVAAENIAREVTTPQPTSTSSPKGMVAFTSEQNGNLDIYTVHPDGSGLTNLTNNSAKDYSPTWSPDGTHIAFVSDRDGNDNIYIMNFDGTNVLQLTDDEASDSVPLWSPDGTKIAYMSGSFIKKNTNIHVVDLNGQNHRQLTNYSPGTGVMSHAWSPDSQYILFDVNFRITRINANGGDITPVAPPTKTITPYYVMSKDSSMLSYLTDCEDIKTFCYELRLAYRDGTHQESSTGFKTLKTPELCEIKQTATWTGTFVKWSPDQSKILFAFTCEESGWLYISNADGSDFKPLTNYPILGNGPQNEVVTFDWSSDSQSIVFISALNSPESESLYILNINDALQNPELRPTGLNTSATQVSSPAWQPIP